MISIHPLLNARRMGLAGLSLLLLPSMVTPAVARPHSAYSMQILVDGVPLKELAARGGTYIEALEGREYSIRLRNHTARRVAVALSIDGLNTIDAKTTSASDASKWILGPHQTITLDGWQTSAKTARRFFFTSEKDSYGAWLGKTRNLGVISAAVYREKQPRPLPIMLEEKDSNRPRKMQSGSSADAPSAESGRKTMARQVPLDDLAATGIGSKMGHSVKRVAFDAEGSAAAMIEIRYEYRDALVRLGVLQRELGRCEDPLSRRERAHGFEGIEFAPDPFDPACP